eukprot:TRINITY_DN3040_c0_g1_i3.p1 TRINITY_DN3040_c0_g1~~TRINITY_DN3040_c0_g1_i3.p1  ORF type:complete len:208 (+),score=36.50 TRINITY_DN3040_c0_g1_i3:530-1153(+)
MAAKRVDKAIMVSLPFDDPFDEPLDARLAKIKLHFPKVQYRVPVTTLGHSIPSSLNRTHKQLTALKYRSKTPLSKLNATLGGPLKKARSPQEFGKELSNIIGQGRKIVAFPLKDLHMNYKRRVIKGSMNVENIIRRIGRMGQGAIKDGWRDRLVNKGDEFQAVHTSSKSATDVFSFINSENDKKTIKPKKVEKYTIHEAEVEESPSK